MENENSKWEMSNGEWEMKNKWGIGIWGKMFYDCKAITNDPI